MDAIMTVGVSGSGKSSLAQTYDDGSYALVERDLIRFTGLGKRFTGWRGQNPYKMTNENEGVVSRIQRDMIWYAATNEGLNLILPDTWLSKKFRREMYKTLSELGYDISVIVVEVPLKVAIERDSYRGNMSVGEDVIRRQWDMFQGAKAQLVGEVGKYGISVVHYNNFGTYEGKDQLP